MTALSSRIAVAGARNLLQKRKVANIDRLIQQFFDGQDVVIGDMQGFGLSKAFASSLLFGEYDHLRVIAEDKFTKANQSR